MKYANYFPETCSQIVIGTIYYHFHIGYKAVRYQETKRQYPYRNVAECTQKRIYVHMLNKQLHHSGTEIEILQDESFIPVLLFASITRSSAVDTSTMVRQYWINHKYG